MRFHWGFLLFALCHVALAVKPFVEPEYLEMLRAAGQDEEFAELMGIDVSLVRPQKGRTEEEIRFTTVSPLGDILLTPEQEEQDRQGILFSKYPEGRWPNNQIPYVISLTDYNLAQRNTIESAINAFNSRGSRLRLVPRILQKDYVMVVSGNGCFSNIGRSGNQQMISLQKNGCLVTGIIQHEFIHAAGFTHEHNRLDRDNHVRVLWGNIPQNFQSQYEKVNPEVFGTQLRYDIYSVMHYGINAPGSNKPAFEILDKSVDRSRVGQRNGLTDTDIQKINVLYLVEDQMSRIDFAKQKASATRHNVDFICYC